MSLKTNYFKLGLFIIGATVLLLLILVFFGLGALNKDKIMLESYFDESVQGLDIGSPLKFKGVKIGSVQRIRFVFNKYHDIKDVPFRYVLVEMALDPESAIALKSREDLKEAIWSEVENGLRVRIAPQGLTGTGYLEMDYVNPRANKPLPISWTPEYYYVPSAPSTIARLEETFENFSKLLRKIDDAGVDVAVQNINALLVVMRDAVKDANVPGLSDNVNSLIADLRKTNEHLNDIMASKDAREALKNLGQTLANLKTGTENLPQTIADLRKLLREVNSLVASQRDEVQGLLQQSKQVFENLNDLTGDAKRNPSRLFFGAPPAKVNPEKR
ncbi:MlaD family protein [Fundidesulfovibrio putealis]|uniref:MlaD family protein n=1 Tax=Fundidesulfovibrio putealis TaxID=270496 RepID=UPI00040FCD5C|nr:MlaD family protein [Fundidesulfovibrio putealis]